MDTNFQFYKMVRVLETDGGDGYVVGEIKLFHRITRKAFQGPTHGRLWCDKMVYSGRNLPLGFQCPISLHPAMEKVYLSLSARPKQNLRSRVSALC